MTWSYFTAYLDGARPITKAERDELYDNLATLLSTSGCSAAGYSLHGTDQTAIKDSNLLTDRASLNGPGSTNTKARFQTILSTASSAWSNYSTAVTTALSGEGITSTERDSIITANIDDHRLWNYYRRLLDALTCVCNVPVVNSSAVAPGNACGAFSYYVTGTNSPTSFSATGLPSWATLNTSTGQITGTPSASGSWSITVKAINACGESTAAGVTVAIADPCSYYGLIGCHYQSDPITGENCLCHQHNSEVLEFDQTYNVSGSFPCETNLAMSFNYQQAVDASEGYGFRFEVYANGSLVYQSFCCDETHPSGTCPSAFYTENFAVPAGTTSLRIKRYDGCTPPLIAGNAEGICWNLFCEYPPP